MVLSPENCRCKGGSAWLRVGVCSAENTVGTGQKNKLNVRRDLHPRHTPPTGAQSYRPSLPFLDSHAGLQSEASHSMQHDKDEALGREKGFKKRTAEMESGRGASRGCPAAGWCL